MHELPKINRRSFLTRSTLGLGAAALGSLLGPYRTLAKPLSTAHPPEADFPSLNWGLPTAKRVIYLFPKRWSFQLELFDYKPALKKMAWPGNTFLSAGYPAQQRHGEQSIHFSPGAVDL
jgi:hypothetical protein